MVCKLIIAGFIALALAVPTLARAHGGHAHKVMGTVSSIEGNHLTVKTTDGKTMMVMVDAKTKITQGKTKLTSAALKVGDRIVAEGPQAKDMKDMVTATTVQVGAAAPATTAKK